MQSIIDREYYIAVRKKQDKNEKEFSKVTSYKPKQRK